MKSSALAERETIILLKKRLAEKGYRIFPPAKKFRMHRWHFIAIPPRAPANLVGVYPRKGEIVVRSYCRVSAYDSLRAWLPAIRAPSRIRVNKQLLAKGEGWYSHLPRERDAEFCSLTGINVSLMRRLDSVLLLARQIKRLESVRRRTDTHPARRRLMLRFKNLLKRLGPRLAGYDGAVRMCADIFEYVAENASADSLVYKLEDLERLLQRRPRV